MTYRRWMAARQLLMEEHLGVHIRQQGRREDEAFTRLKGHLERQEKHGTRRNR